MGFFRFRQILKILPGLRVNVGKKGLSLSAGIRGAKVTFGEHGVRTTVGAPGSGLSYTHFERSASRQGDLRTQDHTEEDEFLDLLNTARTRKVYMDFRGGTSGRIELLSVLLMIWSRMVGEDVKIKMTEDGQWQRVPEGFIAAILWLKQNEERSTSYVEPIRRENTMLICFRRPFRLTFM
jgi:hypothetical protein